MLRMRFKKGSILVVSIMLLSIILCFQLVACDEEDDRIALTKDNFEQYVTLSCKGYGDPDYYSRGYYSRLFASASTVGVSGYEYENVFVTVKINFDDGKNFADPEIDLHLNVGGSAYDSTSFMICKKDPNYIIPTSVSGSTISAYTYYEIVSVSGYVKRV